MFWIWLSGWIFFRALPRGRNLVFGAVSGCRAVGEYGMVGSGCDL